MIGNEVRIGPHVLLDPPDLVPEVHKYAGVPKSFDCFNLVLWNFRYEQIQNKVDLDMFPLEQFSLCQRDIQATWAHFLL